MIHVYYGGADRDKDRFLFECIRQQLPGNLILLVPDQFTLQAERNAFHYMNADALLELEIMSLSGFQRRVAEQAGRPNRIAVDQYGRYMLLADLFLKAEQGNMQRSDSVFASVQRRASFVEKLNDQISELKQYNISPEELQELTAQLPEEELLCEKLSALREYYDNYEMRLAGRFMDNEDYLQAVIDRIEQTSFVKNSIFWVDGFDYMTPKMIGMLEKIAVNALELNVLLNGETAGEERGIGKLLREADGSFFQISRNVRHRLREAAERCGSEYREDSLPDSCLIQRMPELSLIQASDFYAEAETIAIDIIRMVRDEGYRYKDIVILCNDAEQRGSVFRRVFDLYGIPLFLDRKRSVTEEPEISFLLSLLDIIRKNRRFDDTFRMLKSGFGPVSDYECEELEKYCRKYRIRSGRWKKEFVYGKQEEGEEALERLNLLRQRVDEFLSIAEKLFAEAKTVRQRCEALYRFLSEYARMPQRCAAICQRLEAEGMPEEAETAAQMWKAILQILDQMVEVLGEEELSDGDFYEILSRGFEQKEIGLLPTNNDQVLFGTMQRTRTGAVKVMFVAGANEGVLPEGGRTESLLSDEEKEKITACWKRICRTDELRVMEQNLAIYKNLTKVTDRLTLSYAEMDTEGTTLRPSELAEELKKYAVKDEDDGSGSFLAVHFRRDYAGMQDTDALLQTGAAATGHVTRALRSYLDGAALEDKWKAAALVLDGTADFETAKAGLRFQTPKEQIDRRRLKELFEPDAEGRLTFHVSAMERYSRCPFSFFVLYGLKPEEERSFVVDMRSIGDIYHHCLYRIASELTEEGIEITAPESRWNGITKEECREKIACYVAEYADSYREGLLQLSGREAYVRERIREICLETAWLMITQVRSGRIRRIYFEQHFGNRKADAFPPILLSAPENGELLMRGIIDRVDVIRGYEENGEAHDYVRIIDYKSGKEKFNLDEVRQGWRLQLMLYLKGAMGAIEDTRPAGVFYFAVHEPKVDVSETSEAEVSEAVTSGLLKSVRLDGILLNNDSVITGMDGNIEKTSEIIPVRKKVDGSYYGSSLLDAEEFRCLIDDTDEYLNHLAGELLSGQMNAEPKKGKNQDACTYCSYAGICGIGQKAK